jgi:hypothetical protein
MNERKDKGSEHDDRIVTSGVETRANATSKAEIKIKAQKRYRKTKDGEEESDG